MVEHRAKGALVPAGQRIEGPAQAVEDAGRLPRYGPGVLGVPGGQVALAEERNQREREEQRYQHRDGERDRKRVKELAHDALEEAERQEHDDGGERGRGDRPDQLLDRIADGPGLVRVQVEVPDDVLRDHHGVVDHEADGDRHRPEGHEVERLPEPRHHEDRNDERERNGGRADRGDPPVPEEEQEHDDGERRTDEHRVAHGAHRVAHQRRLIIDGPEPHPRRQDGSQPAGDGGDAVGNRQRVAAKLTVDVKLRHRPPVAGDDADAVLRAGHHGGEIPYPESVTDDDPGDVVRGMRFGGAHHQVLLVTARQPSDRGHRRRIANLVGQLGVGHPERRQARGIGDDLDLPHVAPEHVHPSDAGDARHDRLDLVAGDVVQGRRVATLDVVRQDREE